MKVAVLNYHNSYNYGAVLQALAIQNAIESLGVDCEILDYRNNRTERSYRFLKIRFNKDIIKNLRFNIVRLTYLKEKRKNFKNWFSFYNLSKSYKKEDLYLANEVYDKFVVGSDQVWNMDCHDADTTYLLDFVTDDNKKISYAASFGKHEILQKDNTLYQKYLPLFQWISVREKRGIELANRYTKRTVSWTMDPVMLVGADFWKRYMSSRCYAQKYIFVYNIMYDKRIPCFVKKLRKQLKLPIIYVTTHIGNQVRYSWNDINFSSVSPEMFLSLLYYAEYVVTDSFHGTALSILFHKQFSVVIKDEEIASCNSRFYSILDEYGLGDRLCGSYNKKYADNKINYSSVDEILEQKRKDSFLFLKSAIFDE